MSVINYVIWLIIIIWSQMSTDGNIYLGQENQTTKHQKYCESCSNETINQPIITVRSSSAYDHDGDFVKQPERRLRSTELERGLNKSNKDLYFESPLLIRLFSIDYKMPVLNSDNKINPVIVVIVYSTTVFIGIMTCISVYRKYGFDKREHSGRVSVNKLTQKCFTSNTVLQTGRLQETTIKKCLHDNRPPSYGSCIV